MGFALGAELIHAAVGYARRRLGFPRRPSSPGKVVARQVVGALAARAFVERVTAAHVRGELAYPDEVERLMDEKRDELRGVPYETLAARLEPPTRFLGLRGPASHTERESLTGESGTAYERTVSVFRDHSRAAIRVLIRVAQADWAGSRDEWLRVAPPAGSA